MKWLKPLSLTPLVFCVGCQAGSTSEVVRTDSAGVEIVMNSAGERELDWTADTLGFIGGRNSGPESFFRLAPALVDVDSSGRIYVLDSSANRVVVFDSSGAYLRSFGRGGKGPGEFEGPISVTAGEDGDVWVYDASKGALVGFDSTGALLPVEPYASAVLRIGFKHAERLSDGFVYWDLDSFRVTDNRMIRLWWRSAADTLLLSAAPWEARTTARYPECRMTFTAARPFAPFPSWSQSGQVFAVVSGATYEVAVFHKERLVRILRRRIEPAELTERDVIAELERRGTRGPCGVPARTYVQRQGFFPVRPLLTRVAVLPDGSIWVLRQEHLNQERIDVFDPEGIFAGTMPPDFPFPLAALPDGRVLAVDSDELGVARLLILEVHRSRADTS